MTERMREGEIKMRKEEREEREKRDMRSKTRSKCIYAVYIHM